MSKITAGIRDASEDVLAGFDGAKALQEAILTSDVLSLVLPGLIQNMENLP